MKTSWSILIALFLIMSIGVVWTAAEEVMDVEEVQEEIVDEMEGNLAYYPDYIVNSSEMEAYVEQAQEALGRIKENLQLVTTKYRGVQLEVHPEHQLMLRIPTGILFDSGSAQLTPRSRNLLEEVRNAIFEAVNFDDFIAIRLEGHTDTDKYLYGPPYKIVPDNRRNRELAVLADPENAGTDPYVAEPVEGMEESGIYSIEKPYRMLPVSPNRFVLVSSELNEWGYRNSLAYNYALGLDRASEVHSFLFDTPNDDMDVAFSHDTSVAVSHESFGFLRPIVSNHPVVYRNVRQANRGRAAKQQNRRVELWFSVWKEGICTHLLDMHTRQETIREGLDLTRSRYYSQQPAPVEE